MSTTKATESGAAAPVRPVTPPDRPLPHLEPFADKIRDLLDRKSVV